MRKRTIIALFVVLACLVSCSTAPQTKKEKVTGKAERHYKKALKMFNARNYFEAAPSFEELKEKHPVSPYATLAELRLGDCHFLQDELELAIHYYDNFKRLHPNNPNVPYSIYMTGFCHFEQLLSTDRDQTAALEAVEYFQSLIELYPESPYSGKAMCKMSEAKKQIAEHEFLVGQFYLTSKKYKGATERFTKVLKQYPKAIDKAKIYYHIAQADFESGNTRRSTKIVELLTNKYPKNEYTARARALTGQTPVQKDNPAKKNKQENKKEDKNKKNKWFFF